MDEFLSFIGNGIEFTILLAIVLSFCFWLYLVLEPYLSKDFKKRCRNCTNYNKNSTRQCIKHDMFVSKQNKCKDFEYNSYSKRRVEERKITKEEKKAKKKKMKEIKFR